MEAHWRARLGAVLFTLGVGACTTPAVETIGQAPEIMPELATTKRLHDLPPPAQPLTVAIYGFDDQTGQRKPEANVAELSTAVTQGGAAILVDAAFRAGDGDWFNLLERGGLQNLLQERQIIRATREQFADGTPLTPLTFGGVLLEGGIISYDTNQLTGGVGARLLGIGGSTEYRADVVAVYLRAASVKTGEIVASVNVSKTLYSTQLQSNVFRFVGFEELLEIDAGITSNEPTQIAVRQAIESAVYALIMEGVIDDLWTFADPAAGREALATYARLVSGEAKVAALERLGGADG
ncbi:MAG: CsgG/HfaB family protein [Alphaproteobacteria bacterium]